MNKKIEPGVPPSSTGQGFNRARTFIQPARVVEFNVHWPDVSFTDEQLKAQAHGKYVFQSDRAGACSLRARMIMASCAYLQLIVTTLLLCCYVARAEPTSRISWILSTKYASITTEITIMATQM